MIIFKFFRQENYADGYISYHIASRRYHGGDEISVIQLAYSIIDPLTVMIEILNAPIARSSMFTGLMSFCIAVCALILINVI